MSGDDTAGKPDDPPAAAGEHPTPSGDAERGEADAAKDGSADEDGSAESKPSPLKNPTVKLALIVGMVVLVIAGGIWFYRYHTHGQYEQSTNDAYLQADVVTIGSKVSGYVDQVLVTDNQDVTINQPLVRIDSRDAQDKMDEAQGQVAEGEAAVEQARAQIRQQMSQIAVAQAQTAGSRASQAHAQAQVDRYAPLTAQGAQTAEQLDQMRQTRDAAVSQVAVDRAQTESARRQIGTMRAQIDTARAKIAQAQAQVRMAQTDLQSTLLRSSIAGRIGDRTVRVGQYVQTGTKLMSVVPVADIYILANFKETQVGLMRIGQPATITVDAIDGGEFHGTVESFAPGTGSQFSVLPPQNATGNFTKVVQRVSVRIRLETGPEARKVLIPGLSAAVTVDTIGAKPEAARIRDEARQTRERRKQQHDGAVKRDRDSPQPGAGQ